MKKTAQLDKLCNFLLDNSSIEEGEIWGEIKQVEGLYFVSNKGRVLSLCRNEPLIMKPFIDKHGYKRITVKGKHYRINRLVAEVFLHNDNPAEKKIVHHKDGNKLNNDTDNLEWVTYSKNTNEYYKRKRQVKENGGE